MHRCRARLYGSRSRAWRLRSYGTVCVGSFGLLAVREGAMSLMCSAGALFSLLSYVTISQRNPKSHTKRSAPVRLGLPSPPRSSFQAGLRPSHFTVNLNDTCTSHPEPATSTPIAPILHAHRRPYDTAGDELGQRAAHVPLRLRSRRPPSLLAAGKIRDRVRSARCGRRRLRRLCWVGGLYKQPEQQLVLPAVVLCRS